MGKKARKKKVRRNAPTKPRVIIEDAVTTKKEVVGTPLKRVACVECGKDRVLVRMSECDKCSFHDRSTCKYTAEPYRLRTVSMNEPMKYNRMTFAVSSSHIQDDARNYYFLTEIMQPTKHITDENYVKVKDMLLRGELGKDKKDEPRFVTEVKGRVFLEETDLQHEKEVCFYNGTKMYREVPEFYTGEAQWLVLFYLYEMYSLDGLADIKIDDKFYKIKGTPIDGYPHSLVIAINGKNIVIGS
jgi:hypothetical protein